MSALWIVESRVLGRLDFTEPQPEAFFGLSAITGLDDHDMAQVIFRHVPDAVLSGDSIATWPRLLDARFIARQKTW